MKPSLTKNDFTCQYDFDNSRILHGQCIIINSWPYGPKRVRNRILKALKLLEEKENGK